MNVTLPSTGSALAFLIMVAFAAAAFVIAHVLSASGRRPARLRNVLLFGAAWFAGTALLVLARTLGIEAAVIVQAIGFFAIIAFVLSAALSGYGKRIAMGLPIVFLVGLHVFRLPLEMVLHQWWIDGFLPVQMTYSGDNFDIVTGILALPVAVAYWRFPDVLWPVRVFNIIGTVLLGRIIAIVNLSLPTPIKAAFGGYEEGVYINLFFPYIWIATVIVTIALFFHVVLFRRLKAERLQRVRSVVAG